MNAPDQLKMSVKERPILFNSAMARAILDGRKTQTRRVISSKILSGEGAHVNNCPMGKVGDRLYVRESFSYHDIPAGEPYHYPADRLRECVDHDYGFHYWADGNPEFGNWSTPKPSIHMPRRASRILLEITNVRVERLNDISELDAKSEGADRVIEFGFNRCYSIGFERLWESINGKGSWELNPWVWAINFEVVENGK